MKTKVVRLVIVSLVLVLVGFVLASSSARGPVAKARQEVQLQPPRFLEEDGAQDESEPFDIGEYLDDEAGISAWYESPMAIDLNAVRGECQTIELETPDYLICSVSIPGYNDYYDPHIYVHIDGWILAYYMDYYVTGWIIDLNGSTINSTLLEYTVGTIAGVAGVPYSGATLYDFRYPSATHMLFVVEDDTDGSADYTINMPTSYAYLHRSWAKRNYCDFRIDGVQMQEQWHGDNKCVGWITYAQLEPGVTHTVDVQHGGGHYDYSVLLVTYVVP